MMDGTHWVIIDTETTGLGTPICVVELAAQNMRGWLPEGEPFRRMLNHGVDIPPEASRVHGYTREILERDGDPPAAVYQAFAEYVGNRPVGSYNLAYDWDDVLLPEWRRLGIPPVGARGLCLLKLAQRLLDPVPAGNCKLQTLRQYYRLPERGAHTALGDVETVIDLAGQVLRPLAEARGIDTWNALVEFSEATWYPSRIAFGKYKGRMFREARRDPALRSWLEWLAGSSNPRSAQMGAWYLAHLDTDEDVAPPFAEAASEAAEGSAAVVIYVNPDLERLRHLIESARSRLAELETTYTSERRAVSATQAKLFELLRPSFQKRDLLKLRLDYRRRFLDALLQSGEEEAAGVEGEYERAREETDAGYEEAATQASRKKSLTDNEKAELTALWRKLVKLFHPDRITDDDAKRAAYQRLTAEINRARDAGDIDRLREIADGPEGFVARQGWGAVDFAEADELGKLQHLYETLEAQIIDTLERLNALRESPEYELHQHVTDKPDLLNQVAEAQQADLQKEMAELKAELERLEAEIESLQA